jgi:hypothetical protein
LTSEIVADFQDDYTPSEIASAVALWMGGECTPESAFNRQLDQELSSNT